MKKLILTILIILFIPFFSLTVFAQDETEEEFNDKIKERLEKTVEQGLEDIKQDLAEKSAQPQKKAYIGSISKIEDTLITIIYKEQEYQLQINKTTNFEKSKSEESIVLDDLEEEDFIIAMGFASEENPILDTRRILITSKPSPPPSRQLITGKVKEIDDTDISFDGKTISIGSKTPFAIQGIEDPEIEDLQLEDNVFAIVTLDKNGDIDQTNQVFVIPGKNNPASEDPTNLNEAENASPSADQESEETEDETETEE